MESIIYIPPGESNKKQKKKKWLTVLQRLSDFSMYEIPIFWLNLTDSGFAFNYLCITEHQYTVIEGKKGREGEREERRKKWIRKT